MDLKALWAREKARFAAEVNDAPKDSRRRGSVKEDARAKPSAVSAPSPTVKISPAPKKKSSGAINVSAAFGRERERVFQLLLETSATPSMTNAAPNFSGANEFAVEYADRAARRLFGGPPPSQQQPPAASTVQNITSPVVASPTTRGPTGRKSSLHVSSMASLHGQSSSTQVQSTQSSGQPTTFSTVTKTAQNTRKNGRKRVGTEFSSHALKPYSGDIFGTRGDYIDGMLYMSRMKRSYQAMYSGGDQQGRNADPNLPWAELARPEGRSVLKDGVMDAFAVAGGINASSNGGKMSVSGDRRRRYGSTIVISAANDDDDGQGSSMPIMQWKQQQRCSLTLSNWSFNPENARLMVQENVVEALIRLCKDGDETTILNCVTAFMNLSHLYELRRVIVQQGAVKTVAEVVNDTEDKAIRTACAITLCNLCSLEGEEGLLVENGAVSALTTLISEHEKVSHICRSALFNLTCVSRSYHKIEGVLKAFITLTASRSGSTITSYSGNIEEDYDDITAKALCNLSNLKRIRLRLMEEGIISAIASLLHPNTPLIQELLAQILLNLSKLPACRNEMVAKGCMGTLVALAETSSAITTNCLIANTLWNLSKEPGNAVRMVSEGLLLLITELYRDMQEVNDKDQDGVDNTTSMASREEEEELLQVCARTLYNVSCCEDARSKSVERDAVNILSSLSRRATGEDAKQMCTLALCNLLSVQKAAGDIVTAGAITALIQLSMAPAQSYERRNLFSKALHGLCDKALTRVAVADAGVIPALLFLSAINEIEEQKAEGIHVIQNQSVDILSEIRARCTAAFACLAADAHTAGHVCNAAVVRCVTKILALEHSNVVIERFCCSCLSLLCRNEQCSLIMVEVGAIEMVLTTCVESHDLESKASCCHVLASVSCHPSCCNALMRMGVISVLATLAKIKDPAIQRCCAITLANLSVEPDIRKTLTSAGIVAIVSILSNSYSEDSQRDCAKVLCNLSCIRGNESVLVKEGAVGVLMMISMVRAVGVSTKEMCIRALLNLLNAETMKTMVKEGIVKILPAFAGLTSKEVSTLVTIIFSKLLNHPVGRNALCAEQQSLSAIFQLMSYESSVGEASQWDEQERSLASLHETLLSELVYYDNSRLISVHTGILDALHRISVYEKRYCYAIDGELSLCAEKKLALVFFTLAKSEDTRMYITSSSNLAVLLSFLELHGPKVDCCASECALFAVGTLCWLGWHDDTRRFLQVSKIPCALTNMLQFRGTNDSDHTNKLSSYSPQAVKACVLTLSCLAHSSELLEVMLTESMLVYLNAILVSKTSNPNDTETMTSLFASDKEFVALVCYLFRQLSHVTLFSAVMTQQPAPILELFCVLVQRVVKSNDIESSLDCAEVLCSIVFAPPPRQQTAKSPTAGRCGSITQTTRPPQILVEDGVLKAIGSLLCDEQLPETRWRCVASLWALSSVPEYRHRLVELGVTSMLVQESYRAAQIASPSTLQCCAGALCNLTIVSEESNATKMVDEGAIPALIQLAKLENDTIREFCTLALSNLSGPSPTVESGAVSALLNVSLDFMPSGSPGMLLHLSPTRRASQQRSAVLRRPPLVCGERHKQFAVLPEFEIEIATDSSLDEQKFEAELAVSTPPPPHLPPVSVDVFGSSAKVKNQVVERSDIKVEGDSIMPNPDGANIASSTGESTDRVVKRDEVPIGNMQTRFFDKMDPEESLALMTEMEEREGEEDSSWTEEHPNESVGNQEQDLATAQAVDEIKPGPQKGDHKQGESTRSSEHLYGSSLRKVGVGSNGSTTGPNHMLSPLSRVVVRKANTLQAAQKFKDKAVRKLRKERANKLATLNPQASPCLTKISSKSEIVSGDSANNRDHTFGGKDPGQIDIVLKPQSLLASLPPSASTPILPSNNDNWADSHAKLLAAVSAAGLYDAAPPKWQEFHNVKRSKKDGAKDKKSDMEAPSDARLADPKLLASLSPATTIEEFQMQAKKLGLWS